MHPRHIESFPGHSCGSGGGGALPLSAWWAPFSCRAATEMGRRVEGASRGAGRERRHHDRSLSWACTVHGVGAQLLRECIISSASRRRKVGFPPRAPGLQLYSRARQRRTAARRGAGRSLCAPHGKGSCAPTTTYRSTGRRQWLTRRSPTISAESSRIHRPGLAPYGI
jgi:hypothetical protein